MTKPACIVLAGGLGTRLDSVLNGLPKCLAPVGKKTFLEIQLEALAAGGVGHFVLSLGHGANKILELLPKLQNLYSVETVIERERLGTGGGILFSMEKSRLQECLVVNGDTFLDAPLTSMFPPLNLASNELLRVATVEISDRSRFGGLTICNNRIKSFSEKGTVESGSINAGLYRVSRIVFKGISPGSSFSFEQDIMPPLVAAAAVGAAQMIGSFIDIGVPDDYRIFCGRYENA